MKLYIWHNPYQVDYGMSMVFAVANNLREAKKAAKVGKSFSFGRENDGPLPEVKLGMPDRIISLPCAEWHMWSE